MKKIASFKKENFLIISIQLISQYINQIIWIKWYYLFFFSNKIKMIKDKIK